VIIVEGAGQDECRGQIDLRRRIIVFATDFDPAQLNRSITYALSLVFQANEQIGQPMLGLTEVKLFEHNEVGTVAPAPPRRLAAAQKTREFARLEFSSDRIDIAEQVFTPAPSGRD
jgi:hypothetical protein